MNIAHRNFLKTVVTCLPYRINFCENKIKQTNLLDYDQLKKLFDLNNRDFTRINLVDQLIDKKTLEKLRQEYHDEKDNAKYLYYYLRELNRQQKFFTVIKTFEEFEKLKKNQISTPEYEKAKEQVRYAALYFPSGESLIKDKPGFAKKSSIRKYVIRFLIFYVCVSFIATSYMNNKKKDSDSDSDSDSSSDLGFNLPRSQSSNDEEYGGFSLTNKLFGVSSDKPEKNISTRFADVLGIDEFKDELIEIVDYLKNPKKYTDSGAKIPKGILLVGPPGTGKTLLARALAGEAGCNFYFKTGSDFEEMFVGVGARRLRELFNKARKNGPSIIFIDEIDALAGKRNPLDPSRARDSINQLLSEMDGFKQSDKVIVIGATNFAKSLDPAVLRPGRFDKTIHIPTPDVKGREQIFNYYLNKIKIDPDVKTEILARATSGFTGADIQNMVNIAILNAIREGRNDANHVDFEFALDRIQMGVGRKTLVMSDKDRLTTAYHEGGHTLVSLLTKGSIDLHKVTILPRGGALGFTSFIPEKDQISMSKRNIIASIDVALGGRVAEELFLGTDDLTTGCSNDLQKATELAYRYVRELAMKEDFGLIAAEKNNTSDKFNYLVDMQVQEILKSAMERVKSLLKDNENKLHLLAKELMKHETLSALEVRNLLQL